MQILNASSTKNIAPHAAKQTRDAFKVQFVGLSTSRDEVAVASNWTHPPPNPSLSNNRDATVACMVHGTSTHILSCAKASSSQVSSDEDPR